MQVELGKKKKQNNKRKRNKKEINSELKMPTDEYKCPQCNEPIIDGDLVAVFGTQPFHRLPEICIATDGETTGCDAQYAFRAKGGSQSLNGMYFQGKVYPISVAARIPAIREGEVIIYDKRRGARIKADFSGLEELPGALALPEPNQPERITKLA